MKKILYFLLLPLFFCACGDDEGGTTIGPEDEHCIDWYAAADSSSTALLDHFWNTGSRYFNYDSNGNTQFHYWPQAHAMDVLVDAYMRTGDDLYKNIFPLWWEGMPRFNFAKDMNPKDPWWNVFVDDMEWIILAQIRMFGCTHDTKYIAKARQMYDDWVWPTWGPEDEAPWYGGITWKTDVSKSKNACSNGPAALIAARLYRFYADAGFSGGKVREAYLNEAIKIYMWEKRHLFDTKTGAVYDHMNGKGEIQKDWIFTYNIGTFLGAAYELYKITGDRQYLEDAVLASDYVINHLSKGGVLSDATSGDGGLFHGIFFRYFVKLVNEEDLAYDVRKRFHDYLTNLALVMAREGVNPRTMLYGGRWRKAPADDEPVGLTSHLTGCMLMEAMCVLKPLKNE